ncbi:MAG: TonB-dependent receptor [Bacteroidales bacterium]|nr:TonB-dependent receptor [Bacteroidales bacterium]
MRSNACNLLVAAALLILGAGSAIAQNRTLKVQGVVSDAKGETLIGAMVYVQGTSNGAMTDASGRYTISGVQPNATLVASLMGYEEQTTKVDGRTAIDFVLKEDAMVLEEAVAIGYGSQRKVTLTGSVTTTSGDALVKNSSVNLSQGLAGRVSGVIVNNRSGEPGRDDAVMYIRGRSTLGNNSPLIIIDGVPGRGDEFSRLTGEEIESVNVLKDASAAIYGARSANGVILVTTKRGSADGRPTVTFTYDRGWQAPTRLLKMADAVTFAEAYNRARAITGASAIYTEAQIEHYRTGDDPISYPNTDWFKEIIKDYSSQHKYGVSLQGGAGRVSYFLQFNGQYQDGIYVKSATNYNQYNVRSNIDIKVTDDFKLGLDLNVRQQHKNYSAYPSDSYGIFYITTRRYASSAPYYPNGYLRSGANPAALVQDLTGYDNTTYNTIATTFRGNYDLGKLAKGLSVNAVFAYDVHNNFHKNWSKNWPCYSYDEITEIYQLRDSGVFTTPTLNESQNNYHTVTLNANINYDHEFDGGHHVTALAGIEQSNYRKDYFNAAIEKYDSDILDEFFAGNADKSYYKIGGYASETARRSFFGRVGYDYKSKYLFQALVRWDGSENFPKEHRWGVFPGASVGWRLSEEPFIKDNYPWITNLKIRGSYGEQGNDQVDAFQYLSTYEYTTSTSYRALYGNKEVNYIIPDGVPNPNITWEVARTWNLGLDGSLWNGLLGFEFEVFKTRRSNILCTRNASIPYYTGLTTNLPDENIGIVSNKGFELQINHENKVGHGADALRYHITSNFMFAKNTIEYMDETPYDENHQYMNRTGHPMGASLIYQVEGINRNFDDIANHPQMAGAGLGDFYFKDLDGNGIIDSQDRLRCDLTAVPQIVFGINGDLQWKNFDLSLLLQGQARARYYYAPLTDPVSGNIEYDAAVNAWYCTIEKDAAGNSIVVEGNPGTNYPRIASNIGNGGVYRSSYYYRNAAFLRLKNLEIGYTLPGRVFGHQVGIKNIRFYLAGYNLLTFSELKTIDPETSDEGYQTYPQVKIYNAGVKVTF